RLTTSLHALHVARAFALDDLFELIPVQLAKVVVAAFFVPLQVWVFKAQAQSFSLRDNHVHEALAQLIVGEALIFHSMDCCEFGESVSGGPNICRAGP